VCVCVCVCVFAFKRAIGKVACVRCVRELERECVACVCVCVSACTVNVVISLKESFKHRQIFKKNVYYFSLRKKPMHLRSRKFSLAFKDSHFPIIWLISFSSCQNRRRKKLQIFLLIFLSAVASVVRQNDLIHQIALNSWCSFGWGNNIKR